MKYIKVSGYKAINKEQEITFAPINLLIGPNGSGKSTVINSLLMSKYIFGKDPNSRINSNIKNVVSNPNKINGQFSKNDFNINSNDKTISFCYQIELDIYPYEFELKLIYKLDKKNNLILNSIQIYNTKFNLQLFSINFKEQNINQTSIYFTKLNLKHLIKYLNISDNSKKPNYNILNQDYSEFITDEMYDEMHKAQEEWEKSNFNFTKNLTNEFHKEDLKCELFCLNNYKTEEIMSFNRKIPKGQLNRIKKYDTDIKENKFIKDLSNGIEYTSLNIDIQLYAWGKIFSKLDEYNHENWYKIYKKLIEEFSKSIDNAINKLVKSSEQIQYIQPIKYSNFEFNKTFSYQKCLSFITKMGYNQTWLNEYLFFVNYWLKIFSIEKKLIIKTIDDVLNYFSENINNFGFGLNQLIPIIMILPVIDQFYDVLDNEFENIYIENAPTNITTFLIEEPEANLHPSFQSKLADLFIDAAWKFRHQFIIETHSEYMVRKFQYWVAKKKIKPSDVNIYYFENKNEDKRVKDLKINKINIEKDGSLSQSFGEGFYDEADKIALELFLLKKHQTN